MKEFILGDGLGFAELTDHMACDLAVVNAARVSYKKRSAQLSERDVKLIRFLMREQHGSPFEHCVFRFEVKAPLFVTRQWMRHRIASYNEQSGRWTEFDPEFYFPDPGVDPYYRIGEHSRRCFEKYQQLLGDGWPKEQARMVLPQNLYTTFWFTVNARSLMNFIMLRAQESAQSEIRKYADVLEQMAASVMPQSFAAFIEYGRRAP